MQRRLIRIETFAGVITVCCGLWMLDSAMAASPQSVESIVQQRMDAGSSAVESAADSASQETPQGSTTSAPSTSEQPAEQPAPQVQPTATEEPSSMAGDTSSQPAASTPPTETPAAEATTQPAAAAAPESAAEAPTQSAAPATPASAEEAQSPSSPTAAPPSEAEAPTPPESPAEAPQAAPATEVAQSESQTAPPTYTVMPGDTLWSISSLHLSDPFNWPKLWNVNPSVANPDLIYPGNILMLPTGKPVEAAKAPAPPVAEAPPAETKPEETAKEETPPAEEEAPPPAEEQPAIAQQQPEEQETPQVESPAEAAMTHAKELLIQSSGFIATESLPVTARVVGTFNSRTIFSDRDTIYLLPKSGASLEENGRYTIYRPIQEVVHPITKRKIGELIQILGEVEVQEAHSPGSNVATGVVVKTFDAIEPGDAVMPTRAVEAAPTSPIVEGAGGSLSGWILAIKGDLHMAGESNVVYIDRGESSGVVVGDHFRVYRQGQRSPAYAPEPIANVRLPDRLIGELEILSVQGETATALLTKTTETVALGDRIER